MNNQEEIEVKEIEIAEKQAEIEEKQSEIDDFEIDESDYQQQYDDILDETNEHIFNMYPSTILQKCDPIMYNCGLSEYVDSIELSEVQEYKDLEEELEVLNDELETLEEELEELQ